MEIIQTILLAAVMGGIVYLILKNNSPRLKAGLDHSVMCDTSALIDGRIVEVARAGFLAGTIVIPSSVLREMQYLADNSDHDKRMRARHGLDVVHELQAVKTVEVQVLDDGKLSDGGVDQRLIVLSKKHSARLLTLDFNLNKVAQAEGIVCLNINELAQSLRMNYLPGEKRSLTLVQKGQDNSQAVGYLEDGTMVVVEQAAKDIGSSVEVEFTRALQTQAGKMLFARKTSHQQAQKNSRPPKNPVVSATVKTVRSQNKPQAPRAAKTPKPFIRPNRKRSPEDSLVELANK